VEFERTHIRLEKTSRFGFAINQQRYDLGDEERQINHHQNNSMIDWLIDAYEIQSLPSIQNFTIPPTTITIKAGRNHKNQRHRRLHNTNTSSQQQQQQHDNLLRRTDSITL